jgi:EmrB/QacA subfamily drug resistance transporter
VPETSTPRHHAVAHRIGLTPEQFIVAAGVMSAMAVAALDGTVVATAMPTIIGQLGGLGEYGWVFSMYLLASTVTVPLYARLADMYGRKPIFMIGLALFVGGSMLCGLSGSMTQLIVFRTIQGLGAGAVAPMAFTIVGDVFDAELRAKVQGLFSSVWGISAVVGPALGSIITTTVGWQWVFYVNLPVGIVAAFMIGRFLHEKTEHHRHRLDLVGAALLTGGFVALIFAASEGGALWGWTSPVTLGLVALSVLQLGLFVVVERRVAEPLIDLGLLSIPIIRAALVIGILSGAVVTSVSTYVPPLVQGVMGGTALQAGIAVAAMSIGWPVGAMVSSRMLLRWGARPIVLSGMAMLVIGALVLTLAILPGDLLGGMLVSAAGNILVGLGMGFQTAPLMIMAQGEVPWQRRAVATGLIQFSRTIGGAVGVGLLGGIVTASVGSASAVILDPIRRTNIPVDQLATMRSALSGGLEPVFIITAIDAIIVGVLAWRLMPAMRIELRAAAVARRAAEAAADERPEPVAEALTPEP